MVLIKNRAQFNSIRPKAYQSARQHMWEMETFNKFPIGYIMLSTPVHGPPPSVPLHLLEPLSPKTPLI